MDSKETNSVEQNLKNDYKPSNEKILSTSNDIKDAVKKKESEKIKKDIDKFADEIKKKFKLISGIGIIPQQASKIIEEEFEIKEEFTKKGLIHLMVVLPEKDYKDILKIKNEIVQISSKINDKFWIHVFTPIDFWNFGLDSKFELFEAIAMSFPIYDKNNVLASIRIAQIHKSLVLRKFEKYVTTYAIGGSFVRGDKVKSSDVDVFVIIDDTDVKKMGRLELLEKLRGIIYSYINEAIAMGGVKIDLNVQVYLLTDFWESVKDAHPVMFTFIRDGVPLYDRGAFLPWKSLLKSGRIRPSPEAIDLFMSAGDKLKEVVDRKLLEIIIQDLYWSTLTPSQGLLMLYGATPQGPRDTVKSLKEIFVENEKLLEEKYANILEEIAIKYYKGFEHRKIKPEDIDGKMVDKLAKDAISYIERLKELRLQIEKRNQEKGIEQIYNDLFTMLKSLLKEKEEIGTIKTFDKTLIKTGKFPKRFLDNIKYVAKIHQEFSEYNKNVSGKIDKEKALKFTKELEKVRKLAGEVINALIEYTQRCDFLSMDRSRFIIKTKNEKLDVFFLKNTFIVKGNEIKKIEKNKIIESSNLEMEKQMIEETQKENEINFEDLETIKKQFGNFELTY